MSAFYHNNPVNRIYRGVIEEVCNASRESFLDEGLDEQVLQDFKQVWESKVLATKAIDSFNDHPPAPLLRSNFMQMPPTVAVPITQQMIQPIQLTQSLPSNLAFSHGVFTNNPPGFVVQPLRGGTAVRFVPASAAIHGRPAFFASNILTAASGTAQTVQQSVVSSKNVNQVTGSTPPTEVKTERSTASKVIYQIDGPAADSEEELEEIDDEECDLVNLVDDSTENAGPVEDGEPLNSDDDISVGDPCEIFESDNVTACQYEKVTRTRNKWKFIFKDGIMNINGKDLVKAMLYRWFSQTAGSARVVKTAKKVINTRVPVIITDRAKNKICEYLKQKPEMAGLKIGVKQRGCSGLSYTLNYVRTKENTDEEVIFNGVRIFIEPKALLTIIGSEIDYVETRLSTEFVFRNPNIKATCGCGEIHFLMQLIGAGTGT
ncbi:Iron-sulfur cluster assembly 1 -like protein, mitochondrial [Trichinella murrelli]|uniref:Iron-sulfur cluster assembly 1 homolog, mitochondrial n=1 Tax=Trichinella murrelli TaxID=144512 RepID=A0A0V0U5N2_9BILA|nr:Iron-sulfur cluster assembly 1 -like protein, mitochondrial [Trichinella murrelli]